MKPEPHLAASDPERERVVPNAALAVAQVVVTGITLFVLYRFLLSELGVEALGVWSLVIAATSLANVSNMGLAGGTVRFVSKYLARGDAIAAGTAAETAILSIAGVMGLAALALWPAGRWVVGLVVSPGWTQVAFDLLPFTLMALWLQSVGSTIHSGLDGCHRAGTRAIISTVTQPLVLLFGVLLVPRLGLKGIAVAQMLQYCVWVILGWVFLRRYLPSLRYLPRRWSRGSFMEMWRYGLSFQAITILTILADPLAKAFLSHFGGLSALGYFEMANRLVLQVRSFLVAANQVLVPYYSKVTESSRGALRTTYQTNLGVVTLVGGPAFGTPRRAATAHFVAVDRACGAAVPAFCRLVVRCVVREYSRVAGVFRESGRRLDFAQRGRTYSSNSRHDRLWGGRGCALGCHGERGSICLRTGRWVGSDPRSVPPGRDCPAFGYLLGTAV